METAENRTVQPDKSGDSYSPEMQEDFRLLALVAGDDQPALAGLYRRRGPLLYSLIVRMLGNEMEAQEVMQDTFIQIWRRAGRFDPQRSSPVAWMIMIARGLAVDRLRTRSRRTAGQSAYEQEMASLELQLGTASRGERDDLAAACARAVNRLPDEQAHAVQLAFLRGWTHEEIAQSIGAPLGTVKARIRRGLLALRKIMEDHHG